MATDDSVSLVHDRECAYVLFLKRYPLIPEDFGLRLPRAPFYTLNLLILADVAEDGEIIIPAEERVHAVRSFDYHSFPVYMNKLRTIVHSGAIEASIRE